MPTNFDDDRVRNVVSEHIEQLAMKPMTVSQFANSAILKMCDRCALGHHAWREERHGTYEHGVDTVEGIDWNPSACDASAIHEVLYEMRGEQSL